MGFLFPAVRFFGNFFPDSANVSCWGLNESSLVGGVQTGLVHMHGSGLSNSGQTPTETSRLAVCPGHRAGLSP